MHVLVTTTHRGVFGGSIADGELPDTLPGKLTLEGARNCLYWSTDVLGFMGLATTGPSQSCRVGPKVKMITLYDVTSITPMIAEAWEKWEAAPWRK